MNSHKLLTYALLSFVLLQCASCFSTSRSASRMIWRAQREMVRMALSVPPDARTDRSPQVQSSPNTRQERQATTQRAAPRELNTSPPPVDPAEYEGHCGFVEQNLEVTNWLRSANQVCGEEFFDFVHQLQWDETLAQAAMDHAVDIGSQGERGHTGTDGSSVRDRILRYTTEYDWTGENLAFCGQFDHFVPMVLWMRSTGHCRNIMNENYTHVGIAYFRHPETRRVTWAMKLGGVRSEMDQARQNILSRYNPDVLKGKEITVFISGSRYYNAYAHNLHMELNKANIDHEFLVIFRDDLGKAIKKEFGITDRHQLTNIVVINDEIYEEAYTLRHLVEKYQAKDKLGNLKQVKANM